MEKYTEVLNYLKERKEYFQWINFSKIVEDYTKAIEVIEQLLAEIEKEDNIIV